MVLDGEVFLRKISHGYVVVKAKERKNKSLFKCNPIPALLYIIIIFLFNFRKNNFGFDITVVDKAHFTPNT